jgi:outer membrane protein OmpA-like peptidoglycan-associated protein
VAPEPVTFVRGYAYDSLSRERLTYTRIILSDATTGEKLQDILSNRGDGSYTLVLKPRVRYAVFADRIGYTEVVDTLYYDTIYAARPAEWNVTLLPSDYEPPTDTSSSQTFAVETTTAQDEALVLRVHFEKNSVAVDDSTWDYIARTMEPYADSTSTIVLVNSYTDDSGTPLLNTQISELRAKLVADIVKRIGVPRGRIQVKGWADAAPLAPNDSDANRKMNRRVEVVVRRALP